MAWTAAKLLLVAGFVALGIAVVLVARPITNPGVQECGSALEFYAQNRENTVVRPGEPDSPADAVARAGQPSCRDRAFAEIQRAALAGGAAFALCVIGIVTGLVDDRITYWRAPRYESLLRDWSTDARQRHGLVPRVGIDEIESRLPPLEAPEVWGLVLFGALAFVALPAVATFEATRAVAEQMSPIPLFLMAPVVLVAFLAAAAARKAVYPAAVSWAAVTESTVAACWDARLRPLMGWFGFDIHVLRSSGAPRRDAVTDVRVLQSASALIHVVLLALAAWSVTRSPLRPEFAPGWTTAQWVLVGATGLMVASGLLRLPKVVRGWPVRPGVSGIALILRTARGPERVAQLVVATAAITAANLVGLALALAAFGSGAPIDRLCFVYLLAVSAAALSRTPNGAGVFEAAMAMLLMVVGIEPGVAVCATLTFRLFTYWVPMLPAGHASAVMARRAGRPAVRGSLAAASRER
jgi:hypothetical protein